MRVFAGSGRGDADANSSMTSRQLKPRRHTMQFGMQRRLNARAKGESIMIEGCLGARRFWNGPGRGRKRPRV